MKKALIFAFAVFLSACAAQPQKVKETASGWPEIEVQTTNKKAVKENIIQRNAAKGWSLEQESESMLLFTLVDSSGSMNSIMTQALIGNSYSTPPKYEARYIINNYSGQVKVIVNVSVSTQMAFGQIKRLDLKENNTVFNAFQNQLITVKKEVEN